MFRLTDRSGRGIISAEVIAEQDREQKSTNPHSVASGGRNPAQAADVAQWSARPKVSLNFTFNANFQRAGVNESCVTK